MSKGEEIAAYPDDTPYPSRPLLGWRGDKPLHVVVAYNAQRDAIVLQNTGITP